MRLNHYLALCGLGSRRACEEIILGGSVRINGRAVRELATCGDLRAAQVAIACRSAIRNGQPLSRPAMQTLLDRWQRTRNPRTCPHGRPIYLALDESALGRFFRRRWVVGKSHGLGEFQVNPSPTTPQSPLIFWDP